ncbi:hypothetical protein BGZ60DRAFT_42014 [Tricladium varicosporioides]|nr:hypothetical protein BGZ60DRAFT_42014 [Hymenoscyphus varicosporioides]
MRNPGGLLLNKCIFIFVNLGLILAWYAQLNAEAERVKCEKEREELKWWDEVLSVLRREREAGREFSKDLYQASFPGEQ